MLETATSGGSSLLDLYEPLKVIGNGLFSIVRKVQRKSDGEILVRKELNFKKMSEGERNKIMVEVNILKNLHHKNIVRYIDQFVDNDTGILYILMEYCEGGDLSLIISQEKQNWFSLISEDVIWSYLLQLLLALDHCHNPRSRTSENGNLNYNLQQILHRDLKPENVFIGKDGILKLGDFSLSKALDQASFTDTFVGTPFYMSLELFQKKSYNTKTDIWSLGCVMYKLCALEPLFHEAQTYDDLRELVHRGSIPPLPGRYSQALSNVITSMLNLNPGMRPSAQQLLSTHLARTMDDRINMMKQREWLVAKERELQTRSSDLEHREKLLLSFLKLKVAKNDRLKGLITRAETHISELLRVSEPSPNSSECELAREFAEVHLCLKSIKQLMAKTEHEDSMFASEAGLRREGWQNITAEDSMITSSIVSEPDSSRQQGCISTSIPAYAYFLPGHVPVPGVKKSSYGSPMSIVGFSPASMIKGSPMSIVGFTPKSGNGSPMNIG